MGACAQAVDYAVPLGVWAEDQVLIRQVGEVAEHLFQDQKFAQPNGCRYARRRCEIHMVDQIDKILSLTAKANGVPGAMDQGVPEPGTGTSSAPTECYEEADGDGEQSWVHSPQRTNPEAHSGAD
jgi:hypothetical protein